MSQRRLKVIAIVGPTASGKSAFAVSLAKKIKGEIISADSRQVYRGLDIGTGKVTKREMKGVPHHLLDIADPKRQFSVSEFVELGREAIADIASRGNTPIIVGGTGFYIDALLGRVTLPEVPPDTKLRKRLSKLSAPKLFSTLRKIDPKRAETIDRHNPVRLIRAIEIARVLGKVPEPQTQNYTIYRITWIGLSPAPQELRKRIHKRLLARVRQGMIAEAQSLRRKGLSLKRMRELGLEYRYLAEYLDKIRRRRTRLGRELLKQEMLEQLEQAIWQYSRRQMTWWRKNKKIRWNNKSH